MKLTNPINIIPTNAGKLNPLKKKLDTNIEDIIASWPISGCLTKIKAINKYTIKLIKYFLLLWLLILFSSISANPIQNTGFTNSIGIKVISIKSSHIFGRILSIGVGTNLFIYVIMNISMVSGLMPVVGIPLPLVSYGGSAMLSIMISIGLVLNMELNANIKKIYNAWNQKSK